MYNISSYSKVRVISFLFLLILKQYKYNNITNKIIILVLKLFHNNKLYIYFFLLMYINKNIYITYYYETVLKPR